MKERRKKDEIYENEDIDNHTNSLQPNSSVKRQAGTHLSDAPGGLVLA